ncbi:pyruvate flavodoxin/ferredoxin oxidoreductase domain protein [Desulfonatronospira thiodismutans ASO3-1]|uniref:Pyruvate flavodoxin/ferredoxin oxidoreductase domain protein n=1 Tax=Desulfonatronospira thiodismutans ASO3-1 TaxID=555779 RepID=D6SSW3_9BACT|nr:MULTISPECIES: 2-oxoacid:acceptor oxidoreductase subunit alpha [Desulfonatronospira]EFI33779.1 pyruvate flavodoxin/ferredoxin oxidoreductase domain protein [Desulfonatronospira thiodismutans ASO3-1]RQD78164.1 MAG: 2-oxoacid:acceptor oxidoreductase subunit alpha [Desulfonatronospira sp. MSAO_Bac3]
MAARSRKNKTTEIFALGNEAVVEGALIAGCTFYAGYPITPSTEIAEEMASRLPHLRGGAFIQMEDEIAGLGAVIGASLAGRKAMTATSGPGFSLMQEHIGYASITEVPLVLVNVMRAGPSTGMPTNPAQGDVQQARWGTHGDHPIIVLSASDVQECLRMTVTAFNYAEKYRTPVILLLDEITAHTREKISLPDPEDINIYTRLTPSMPPEWYMPYEDNMRGVAAMPPLGAGYRYHVTGLIHDDHGYPTSNPREVEHIMHRLFRKIDQFFYDIQMVDEIQCQDAEICIIAYGCVARSAELAVQQARERGVRAGLLKLKTLFPFPRPAVEKMLRQCSNVVVPEMNMGQMSREIKRVNATQSKIITLNRVDGQIITPGQILSKILKG